MDEGPSSAPLQALAKSPLFRGLPTSELSVALEAGSHRRVRRKEFFFPQEEAASYFYVIVAGRIRLTQLTAEGHQVIMRFIGPGDGIGIVAALTSADYPVSAEAITDCWALSWDGPTLVRLMERFPCLAINGMLLVTGRLHELQNRYRELATERVERRVARALLRLARQAGKRTEEGVLLAMPLTRQDLAEMTGTTLYTVSRICSKWESDELIETGRERFVIRNPHGLVTIAEDLPTGMDATEELG